MNLTKSASSLPNTKHKKKQLALHISENTFNRFIDYTTETEKLEILTENKDKQREKLKKASHELVKNWPDAVVNIKKRRRNELLLRRKKIEEERIKLIKKIKEDNEKERALIVKEARKLLMYRKPPCRLINSALMASECFKELNAQLEFNKMVKSLEKNEKNKWIEKMKKETEDYKQKEQKKLQDRLKKVQEYRDDLINQIGESGSYLKKMELQELTLDKEHSNNLLKELNLLEKRNAEELKLKKKELKKMFLESLENKKRYQEEIKNEEEQESCLIEAYRKAKEHLTELTQKKMEEIQSQKRMRSELMAKKCAMINKSDDTEEQKRLEKALKEREEIEVEKAKAKKTHEEKMRAEILKNQAEYEEMKMKKKQEEQNQIAWETFQRIKRDEFNKELKLKELDREWKKKMEMAEELRKQVDEREKERREEGIRNDDSMYNKKMLEKMNEKILAYGQEVLEASKGIRPLFPIIKTIEQFKKESGLVSPAKPLECPPPKKSIKIKKNVIHKQPPADQIFHLG